MPLNPLMSHAMAELCLNGAMHLLSTQPGVRSDDVCRFKRHKWVVELLGEMSSDIGRIGLSGHKRELLVPKGLINLTFGTTVASIIVIF